MKYENGRMSWSSWVEHEKLLEQVVKYLTMMKDEVVRAAIDGSMVYHAGVLSAAHMTAVAARDHARRIIAKQNGQPQGQPAPAQPVTDPEVKCLGCTGSYPADELCGDCDLCPDCCQCVYCARCEQLIPEGELCDPCSEKSDEGALCTNCCDKKT